MDILLITYISIFLIATILIIITLVTLPHVGDERKRMIKTKAQSFTFTIMVTLLTIETVRGLYSIFVGNELYEAKPPFALLSSTAFVYLFSLLFFRKKYGN